jgi:hypothetical protein
MNDLDSNFKVTCLTLKDAIDFNDNKTKKCNEKTMEPLNYEQDLLMHHPTH